MPTVGRTSLGATIEALLGAGGAGPEEIVVVDDRPGGRAGPLLLPSEAVGVRVLSSGGRGPAAARNVGWKASQSEWVAFLDDDVVPSSTWCADLVDDLVVLDRQIAASQGRIVVPLPPGRRPTDWERGTAGLEHACWATADMAYRRDVLEEVGGFDERFERAFREDADLGLRVSEAGYLILRGARHVTHPVRPAARWASLRAQRGNADDVLMSALHGPGWRTRCGAETGRNIRHSLTTASAVIAAASLLSRRRAPAALAAALWAVLTAELAKGRIAAGPPAFDEVMTMAVTSALIPELAVVHTLLGRRRLARLLADTGRAPLAQGRPPLAASGRNVARPGLLMRPGRADPAWKPAAVLFDRDGTLVVDIPYNTDPRLVVPMPGAKVALQRARDAGLKVAVVSNQSGVGTGRISPGELSAVNGRVESLLGPFDAWAVCPHPPGQGCPCRKPAPGLVHRVAAELGFAPGDCVVVGDIGSDLAAASAAGARSVLVPTRLTRRGEIASAPVVAPDILRAVDYVLASTC